MIPLSETAVLLCDLQNDFIHPNGAYGRAGLGNADIAAVVPRLAPLVGEEPAMTRGLTAKQSLVLQLVERSVAENGFSPTYREIANALRTSVNAAADHLRALHRKGHIELTGRHRAIRLLQPPTARLAPFLGVSSKGVHFVFVVPERDRATSMIFFPQSKEVA